MKPQQGVLTGLRFSGLCTLAAAALFIPDVAESQESIFSLLDTQGRTVATSMAADGALTDRDVLSAGGRRIQVWALSAPTGSALQVDLRSSDFDSYLYIVGPGLGEGLRDDDSGDGLNSRLCVSLDDDGEYRIVASSLSGGTGTFSLEVTESPGATNDACLEGSEAEEDFTDVADLPTEGRTLSVGDDASGVLTANGPLLYASPAQAWAVDGQEGDSFSVDLISDSFDAYLIVQGPGLDDWLLDDDGAGRCDSRVTLTFPQTGTYRVVVGTIDVGDVGGPFQLIARETPGPVNPDGCVALSQFEEPDVLEDTEIDEAGSLTLGVTAHGSITGDEGVFNGRSVQGWTLEATTGDRISIEQRSADFDSYLYFTGPGFEEALSNDDGAGNLHSRICVEVPESGTYRVLAASLSGANPGSRFELTVVLEDQGSLCSTYTLSPAAVTGRLASLPADGRTVQIGEELSGSLGLDAIRHPESDYPIQPWSLTLQGQTVFVDVESEQFDPLLYAVGGGIDGSMFVDDAGDGCNTRMQIGPGITGTVTLLVGSFYESEAGDFLLRVSEDPPTLASGGCTGGGGTGDADFAPGATTVDATTVIGISSGESRPIEVGMEADGFLDSTETLPGGQPAQSWTVVVEAGDRLVFELQSSDFDAMLYLDGPGLAAPLMDDDGGGGLDSRIEFLAPESGRMRLIVSALSEDLSGDFRLRAFRRAN